MAFAVQALVQHAQGVLGLKNVSFSQDWRRLSPIQIRLTKGVLLAADVAAMLWSALLAALVSKAWSDTPDANWLVAQDIQR